MHNQITASNYANEDFNSFLASLVADAINSMNARADEILEEIQLEHHENMRHLDEIKKAAERENRFAELLLKYSSIDDLWKGLSFKEKSTTFKDFNEYRFGPTKAESLEGPITLSVYDFLSDEEE